MSAQCEVVTRQAQGQPLGFFERYLTLWVFLCIGAGVTLGQLFPAAFQTLGRLEVARVNLPVAALIWLMIIPMLLKVDFGALAEVLTPGCGSHRFQAGRGARRSQHHHDGQANQDQCHADAQDPGSDGLAGSAG